MTTAPMIHGFFSTLAEALRFGRMPETTPDPIPPHEAARNERQFLSELMEANPDSFGSELDVQAMHDHYYRHF